MHCTRSWPAAALRGLAVVVVCFCGISTLRAGQAPAPIPTDPPTVIQAPTGGQYLPYTPVARRPPIRMLLDDKTYADRKATALKAIDKDALAKATPLPTGYYVLTADGGRPANKAGVKPGDILCLINDKPIANSADWMTAKGEITLGWLDADHHLQSGKVNGGPLGVQVKCIWPGAAEFYWQSGPKNAKWDDDCLVAAATFPTDPELAETALAHALKAGLKDCYFTDLLAAEICWTEIRYDSALHFAYYAWKSDKPPTMDTLDQLLPDLSWITGFYGIGEEVYKTAGAKIPDSYKEDWNGNSERWRTMAKAQQIQLPLTAQIDRRPRWNWLTHGTYTKETAAADFIQLRHKQTITLDSSNGKWVYAVINGSGHNIDLSFTLNIPALDSPDTEPGRRGQMFAGLVDTGIHDMANFWALPMISSEGYISYTLWPGYIWFQAGNQLNSYNVYLPNAVYRNYFHNKLKWRIVSYNHWTEVSLNDAVVYRAPVALPCNNMTMFYRAKDTKIVVSDVKFEEVLDQAKADTPIPADPPLPKDEF